MRDVSALRRRGVPLGQVVVAGLRFGIEAVPLAGGRGGGNGGVAEGEASQLSNSVFVCILSFTQ